MIWSDTSSKRLTIWLTLIDWLIDWIIDWLIDRSIKAVRKIVTGFYYNWFCMISEKCSTSSRSRVRTRDREEIRVMAFDSVLTFSVIFWLVRRKSFAERNVWETRAFNELQLQADYAGQDMTWRDMASYDVTWHDTTRHYTTRLDTTLHDKTWHYTTRH